MFKEELMGNKEQVKEAIICAATELIQESGGDVDAITGYDLTNKPERDQFVSDTDIFLVFFALF